MANTKEMRGLAKDTAIYGLSSIIGKFLNWLLVPLYTYVLKQQADYGIVTNLYAWTALLLVILTYGMETGFFRFANRDDKSASQVYTTILTCIGFTSTLFAVLCCIFSQSIANLLGYAEHREFISLLAIVVSMDAFASIPFAYLRYKQRPIRFAALKLLFVVLNIILNLFFLVLCPKIQDWSIISAWYNPDYGVGYVFVANIIATAIQTLCLLPAIIAEKFSFSFSLLKEILHYSLPLLVLGVAGIMNQTLDRILFPFLYAGDDAQTQLGIYGACFKVAMVMMMFTQAFRYAYEPFVFSKHKDKQSVEAYADAMKYYIIFSYLILLGMIFYLDILKFIVAESYWSGLRIVPVVLWTYIFQGVYFNLSFWYKLTDRTQWGAWFSLIGVAITFTLQIIFVPKIGYMASAASSTVCYFVIMLLSYFVGRRYLVIPYDLKSIGGYTVLTLLLLGIYYAVRQLVPQHSMSISMAVGTVLLIIYLAVLIKKDFPLSGLPIVGKWFKNKTQNQQ
ncbi:MAG: polysaccharide biosynthesis C-terminal domain-containing protein [Paludibacteraceae bacterium]|nr:polysaccharide biosynthesis C-terminal domain-containing protein [Paludibacteraceae bacterium]